MKRDELKTLELNDEQIDTVMKLYGKDVESHKLQTQEALTKAEQLEQQLQEASKTIDGFKELDIDGVKKAAEDWRQKAEQATTEAEQQVQRLKLQYAVDSALQGAKAKNLKAVKALLNAEEMQLAKDGSVIGLDKQLETIKAENDYLFESTGPTKRILGDNQSDSIMTDAFTAGLLDGAGLKK